MECKVLELRDVGTFIPILAVDMNLSGLEANLIEQHYLLRRCGHPCDGKPNIAITRLSADGQPCWNDPGGWDNRTFHIGHKWIILNWSSIKDGDVIDVEFILGWTEAKKESERISSGQKRYDALAAETAETFRKMPPS